MALELMADVARNPTFPEHEIERVRREHLTDIRRGKDDPTFVAESIMPGLVFGPDSRYGHPSIGTESSVAAFTRSDHGRPLPRQLWPIKGKPGGCRRRKPG